MKHRIKGFSNNRRKNNKRTNNILTKNIRTNNKFTHKRKKSKRITRKRRGGTINPFTEIGTMFGTLGSSLQGVVSSLSVPVTTAYNPSLPINPTPSSQFVTNQLPQSIPTIFKTL